MLSILAHSLLKKKKTTKKTHIHITRELGACRLDLDSFEPLWIDQGTIVLTLIPGLSLSIGPLNLSVRYQSILLLELPPVTLKQLVGFQHYIHSTAVK